MNLSQICVVMSLMDSDLDQLLKHKIEFSEAHLLRIIYNTLTSLQFMHEANVMHRDLKSANILITSDCNAKICDFGLSRTIPNACSDLAGFNSMCLRDLASMKFKQKVAAEKTFISAWLQTDLGKRKAFKRCTSMHIGSRWYRAPEVCLVERQYDQAIDMWSFGCILYELLRYTLKKVDNFAYEDFQKERYLFQGDSCFPLSPCKVVNKV